MLAVVIPAHNEEALIARCLHSVLRAASHPALNGEQVEVIVVADSCLDKTASIAGSMATRVVHIDQSNVGAARATGADTALAAGARWLSFTDADTRVPYDWLALQLQCHSEVVCGIITVDDWTEHGPGVEEDFIATYHGANGHRHIHGANLGVAGSMYQRVGGFQPRPFNEDVTLVEALIAAGAHVTWSAAVRVITSARLDSRAPGGFGAALSAVNRRLTPPAEHGATPAHTDKSVAAPGPPT